MKQVAINEIKNIKLVIELDQQVGFYLLVYDLNTGKYKSDYLYGLEQLPELYNKALKLYGIQKEQFQDVNI